ncbi:MAG: anti-sigma factor [Candidatus Eremiobacteraeota bacterium]|nr:anti-sigma factor [Candidatus Eremiobacteraeota bacterium]MBV8367094.1 anti-sigma factor [Candidatus Eremiobacteraeota bacterium]
MSADMHVSDLAAGYALGALSDEERSQVDAHIAACAACRDDVAVMLGLAGTLPLACDIVEPSGALKSRILSAASADIRAGESLARRSAAGAAVETRALPQTTLLSPRPAFWQWGAGIAAAAAIVLGIIAWDQTQQRAAAQKNIEALTAELAAAHQDAAAARDDALVGQAVMAALAAGTYWSMRPHADAGGKMWRCAVVQPELPGHNALLLATVPEPPHGMAYQIWIGRKGAMRKAGMLMHGGVSVMDMPAPMRSGDVVAFSVERPSGASAAASTYAMEMTL